MKPKAVSDISVRAYAAKEAARIVRKFPQIEQEVLAPMLTKTVAQAIYDAIWIHAGVEIEREERC